jgi:hypothetical protein
MQKSNFLFIFHPKDALIIDIDDDDDDDADALTAKTDIPKIDAKSRTFIAFLPIFLLFKGFSHEICQCPTCPEITDIRNAIRNLYLRQPLGSTAAVRFLYYSSFILKDRRNL